MTPQELLERFATGVHDFRGTDFSEQDLEGLELPDVDLTGAIFRGAPLSAYRFRRAAMAGADFTGSRIEAGEVRSTP